jgi:3-deoxy-D-manno-octulosonate 8-phosphate phosphatase (KDO 8-P phosphatase)
MNQLEVFRDIKTFIFDVDGVLTDNKILVMENGRLLRTMSIRDGYAIQLAVKKGFRLLIITGGKDQGVKDRLHRLGIPEQNIFLGVQDKLEVYEDIIEAEQLAESNILYMGDDMPDYSVLRRVGMPTCPADAAPEIRAIARYVSPLNGGQGCARDVIEKVLKLHDQWH